MTSHVDFLTTANELSGVAKPGNVDGISILPTLLGQPQSATHGSLYFEIYEPLFQQAVRMGKWKGYRSGTAAPLELYDLQADPAESKNLADAHPDIVKQIETIMAAEHTPSPHYTAPARGGKGKAQFKKTKTASSSRWMTC